MSSAISCKQDVKLSWFTRYRWRRQFGRLANEWMQRTANRIPQGPDLCQRCNTRPTTHDVIYGHGSERRYAYFCDECATLEPPGHFIRGHHRRT